MARLNETIQQGAFAAGTQAPMLDLSKGGYNGWAPDLRSFVSNAAYMRGQLTCIVLETPGFFQLMEQPQKWVDCLKQLMEVHTKTIDGFNGTLKVDFEEHDVGGAGEKHQEIANVTRERTTPSTTVVEKAGLPITTLLYNWIIYGMMDPDTKYAMVGTLAGDRPEDLLPDWNTMTCLFYEADALHRRVLKSWVTTNMMPQTSGEIVGKRDLASGRELSTLTIEWTGISQFNLGGNNFAQSIIDSINITNAVPHLRPSFIDKISSDLEASTNGYKVGVEDLGANAVPGIN